MASKQNERKSHLVCLKMNLQYLLHVWIGEQTKKKPNLRGEEQMNRQTSWKENWKKSKKNKIKMWIKNIQDDYNYIRQQLTANS